MSISHGIRFPWLLASLGVGVAVCAPAAAAVRFVGDVNWSPSASGNLYISLNSPTGSPTTSTTAVAGWDLGLHAPQGSGLSFSFPAPSVPGPSFDPNPWYGVMRAPGSISGPGANLALNTVVRSNSSFADGGSVSFGSGSGQWRLNGENFIGFRFRMGTTNNIHFGWARVLVGASASSFRITHFAFEDVAGASIMVGSGMPVPGPGTLALVGAGMFARSRRRR